MHNTHTKNGSTECLECNLPAQERLNYFTGQFLAERDFRDEQIYHLGKHRQHNHEDGQVNRDTRQDRLQPRGPGRGSQEVQHSEGS